MSPNERRAEIVRIMVVKRVSTIAELASELSVSERTVRRDIQEISVDTPIETVQGNGGGVQIPDWYHPHRYIFSEEQSAVLEELMGIADDYKKEILRQMLAEFSSQSYRRKYAKKV